MGMLPSKYSGLTQKLQGPHGLNEIWGNWWCKSQLLVQIRLNAELPMFCAVCMYQKRQAVTKTYPCSVWSCYAHTGHSCTRQVPASPEDGSAASRLAQGEGGCRHSSLSGHQGPYQLRALQSHNTGKDCHCSPL